MTTHPFRVTIFTGQKVSFEVSIVLLILVLFVLRESIIKIYPFTIEIFKKTEFQS